DQSMRFIATNAAFQTMLGYTEEELQDASPLQLVVEEEREVARTRLSDLREGRCHHYEVMTQYLCKNGRPISVNAYVSTVPGSDKNRPVFLATAIDVSARVEAETAARETQAELARVARLTTMGELAASIAHEINQPLAAVVTFAHSSLRWLARDTPNIEE